MDRVVDQWSWQQDLEQGQPPVRVGDRDEANMKVLAATGKECVEFHSCQLSRQFGTVEQMSATLTSPPQLLPAAEANLGYLFRLAYQRFRALLEDELEDIGLSAQEYAILSVFETRAELSTSELARVTQVTRQSMHPVILRLESAGLLERRARNQRVVLLRPTKRGRDVLRAATRRIRVVERAAFAGLSQKDEATVRAWLARLAAMPTRPGRAEAHGEERS
jgi:DNA-binding MarR family transcriptional regulator